MQDNVVYKPKTKTEYFIVLKVFKIFALFGITWFVLKLASIALLGLTGFYESDAVDDGVLYAAIALSGYYVFLKTVVIPVDSIVFDYDNQCVTILYKHYFLHLTRTKNFPLNALSSTLHKKQSFFQGQYLELTIFHRDTRVAFIGKGASDWQRLPNFITRIHERITEVNPRGSDLIIDF